MFARTINCKANYYQYPNESTKHKAAQLVMSDLHANAMLLIHFLVANNIININKEDYKKLGQIYSKTSLNITSQDINEFQLIINKLTVNDNVPRLLFIGKELCAAGNNDLWMLLIIEKLDSLAVNFEILLSQNGIQFLLSYESQLSSEKKIEPFASNDMNSLQALHSLLYRHELTQETLRPIIRTYLSHLKLVSYSIDDHNIAIYSHAAIDLKTINYLALQLNVNYEDTTAVKLASTIDEINKQFANQAIGQQLTNLVGDIINHPNAWKNQGVRLKPIMFTVLNKDYNSLERPVNFSGYQLHFVHGHFLDGYEGHIMSLNTSGIDDLAIYKILACNGQSLAEYLTTPLPVAISQLRSEVQQYISIDNPIGFQYFLAVWQQKTGIQPYDLVQQVKKITQKQLMRHLQLIKKNKDFIDKNTPNKGADFLIGSIPIYITTSNMAYSDKGKTTHLSNRLVSFVVNDTDIGRRIISTIAYALLRLVYESSIKQSMIRIKTLIGISEIMPGFKIENLSVENWQYILFDEQAQNYMKCCSSQLDNNQITLDVSNILDFGLRVTLLEKMDAAKNTYLKPKGFFASVRHGQHGKDRANDFCRQMQKSKFLGPELLQQFRKFIASGAKFTHSFRTYLEAQLPSEDLNTTLSLN